MSHIGLSYLFSLTSTEQTGPPAKFADWTFFRNAIDIGGFNESARTYNSLLITEQHEVNYWGRMISYGEWIKILYSTICMLVDCQGVLYIELQSLLKAVKSPLLRPMFIVLKVMLDCLHLKMSLLALPCRYFKAIAASANKLECIAY